MLKRNAGKSFFYKCLCIFLFSIALSGNLWSATRSQVIREKLLSEERDYVFVAMHRGDWRNYPENSKGAILSSIKIGADIVELDVQRTKDGCSILNHDTTLNRTTTGKGKVSEMTLAEIKKFKMRDSDGKPTEYEILTLEEALELTRGKILVNIDKFARHPREILDAVAAVGAYGEVLVKASFTAEKAKSVFGPHWKKVESGELLFMPIVSSNKGGEKVFLSHLAIEPRKGSMYEMCFSDSSQVPSVLQRLAAAPGRPRLWVNTLWDSISAKHSDQAALKNPDANWGWWLERGATMIQSDYAAELIEYLKKKGRR
jgi:glycerophosphoryl diester phosphodiesterase